MMGAQLNFAELAYWQPQRLAILRALPGLGDFLCAVPALRALRYAFPLAQIQLIGLPQNQALVQRFSHYLDGWIEFPGFPGIPEAEFLPERTVAALAEIQQLHLDLVLQLHGNGSWLNSFALLLGAQFTAGCCLAGQCPDSRHFLVYPDQEPEIWRALRLLEFLGIPLQGDHLEFPISLHDWQEWQTLASEYDLVSHQYICVHPGASAEAKCWQPQQFAAAADALAAQGWTVVLTGTALERELTQAVAQQMTYPAIDLAGQTSLGGLAVLLKHSRLLISNDTGVSHLAAALEVNSVVVFSQTDPQRWAPLNQQRHRVIQARGISAMPSDPLPELLRAAHSLLHQELAYAD